MKTFSKIIIASSFLASTQSAFALKPLSNINKNHHPLNISLAINGHNNTSLPSVYVDGSIYTTLNNFLDKHPASFGLNPYNPSLAYNGLNTLGCAVPNIAVGSVNATTGVSLLIQGACLIGSGIATTVLGVAQIPLGTTQTVLGAVSSTIRTTFNATTYTARTISSAVGGIIKAASYVRTTFSNTSKISYFQTMPRGNSGSHSPTNTSFGLSKQNVGGSTSSNWMTEENSPYATAPNFSSHSAENFYTAGKSRLNNLFSY